MIKYYAYYNHGGYKDFYLGSIQDEDEAKYYLPLLNIHEQSLIDNPDEDLSKEVEHQKLLPKLVVLSDNTIEYNYPNAARSLMSHAGYKLLYRQFSNTIVLAIRDIPGSLDGYGRKTPYNVMFFGDREDRKALDILAEYIRHNTSSFENFLNTIFEDDLTENGLKVHLQELNTEIKRIMSSNEPFAIDESLNKSVRMIVIPAGMELSNCLREQSIQRSEIAICYNTDGALIYKAVRPPQVTSNVPHQTTPPEMAGPKILKRSNEQTNPSLHAMLNVAKREDIEKLWEYIKKLEERISKLENNQ